MDDSPAGLAAAAASAGAQVAADRFRTDVAVETKAHKNDLVSRADRAAQTRVSERLQADSDAPIVGEEDDEESSVPTRCPAWVVDPIDGTANYLRGYRLWATVVAALEGAEPVAAATRGAGGLDGTAHEQVLESVRGVANST